MFNDNSGKYALLIVVRCVYVRTIPAFLQEKQWQQQHGGGGGVVVVIQHITTIVVVVPTTYTHFQCVAACLMWRPHTRHVIVLSDHEAGLAECASHGAAPAPADPLDPLLQSGCFAANQQCQSWWGICPNFFYVFPFIKFSWCKLESTKNKSRLHVEVNYIVTSESISSSTGNKI